MGDGVWITFLICVTVIIICHMSRPYDGGDEE